MNNIIIKIKNNIYHHQMAYLLISTKDNVLIIWKTSAYVCWVDSCMIKRDFDRERGLLHRPPIMLPSHIERGSASL